MPNIQTHDLYEEDGYRRARLAEQAGADARTAWQHHLPPAKSLRYSITFRTLRRKAGGGRDAVRFPAGQ